MSPAKLSWFQAQEFCYEKGGYLAEIMDLEEENLLESFLSTDMNYWLGLADFASEGTFLLLFTNVNYLTLLII